MCEQNASFTVTAPTGMVDWLESEAKANHRSRSKQIAFCLELARDIGDIRRLLQQAAARHPPVTVAQFLVELEANPE